MTIFDTETDEYLERLGTVGPSGDWDDVLRRARRDQRARRVRVGVGSGAALAAAVVALAAFEPLGGESLMERAEAAVLTPVRAADGTVEHVLIEYRTPEGDPFIEYETWIAADGAWCRRTVEGIPGQRVPDTRLTQCRSATGVLELYLPATNEILRTRPGAATGARSERRDDAVRRPRKLRAIRVTPAGKLRLIGKPGAEEADGAPPAGRAPSGPGRTPGWLTEDVIDQFRRDAVHEAGTMRLDGREYAKLVTDDRLNTILVDPETGEAVAWIPSPEAFGRPTTVVRTRQTLPDDARSRRHLSLTELHPDAVVRDVSPAERERAIQAQYPRG
jgi:hypothetical protein